MPKKHYNLVRKLAGFTRKIEDPYNKNHFTYFEAFVPKPTKESPLPCILVSIRNGHQKLFFRVDSLKALSQAFKIPRDAKLRLSNALISANQEADQIEREYKLLFALRKLPPGAGIARTDTGEVIAEAERIINGKEV